MKVLIAPDKFKGSLSANEVCEAIASGIKKFDSTIQCVMHPLADGGDGSLEVISEHLQLETITITTKDPLFRPIQASYKRSDHTAYIEMAASSGLALLKPEEQNCKHTTTYGTGQLINDAMQKGARTIYLFIGGSATCDAGIGMAASLGYKFLDKKNKPLLPTGDNLIHIQQILAPDHLEQIEDVTFVTLCDVDNPLFGKQGAAQVFAAQKGANSEDILTLDQGLFHFSSIVAQSFDKDVTNIPGAGAAGGLGAGSIIFLNATLQSGIDALFEITKFPEALANTDLIFTGEGKIDHQTLNGKVVYGVSKLAKAQKIPVYGISGVSELSASEIASLGISHLKTVLSEGITKEEAFTDTKRLVEKLAKDMIRYRMRE
ncbi:glycerate kinase [Aquimarina sp. U1-2]|uniref:glycerate kinase family protein n=1 Tax=Aquimarina sp. U1-2 TaxID=2823141 RepID=UPI001AECA4B6|nr:glycerate kinase [Aquimarina sp. U1-2]MBP2833398.1 glycerate kinase [Aquimarina sp. U1-2]